jgi:signal transduction histidine kinase
MAETLEMGAFKDTAQREKFARQIIKEAERLGSRVDEVLRAASRPHADQVQAVDIDVLVKEINDRWQQLYEQQGATLILEASPIGTLQTSRSLLRDALYNLLDNALKYRREDRPGKVIFRVITDRSSVSFEVEDNGLGVPSNMRKAVFERFRRVEGPGRGLAGGHGLGLYFVAEAARSLGGKVDCRDGAEGGARFVIKIPRRT